MLSNIKKRDRDTVLKKGLFKINLMKCKTIILLVMCVAASTLLIAQGIHVEPKSCIKVESGTTLDVSVGDLILKSDATGDASLIDLGNVSYTGSGKAKVERYLTNGKWHMISAPVSEAVSGMFAGNYLQYHNESTNAYTDIIPLNTPLNIMQGYALWTVDEQPTTKEFSGTSNTGSLSFDFTKSEGDGFGWNLVGNPYPSVLDWDEVTIPTQLNGTIWLFDPTVGTNGTYKYYIKDGGTANTTSQYIPSGQGFFVRATAGGTLTFGDNARVHGGGQTFYKAAETNQMLLIRATGNGITTQTAIRFNPEATQQADRLYDVFKIMTSSPDVPNVYTQIGNEKMAINTLPRVSDNEIVPIYFEAGMDGTYVFDASEIESLNPEVPVFLEDVAADYFQNLRTNPQYSFAHTSGAVKDFKIHFKDVTGIETPETLHVACYLSHGVLYVNFAEQEITNMPGGAMLSVYSVTGQQLLQAKITQAFSNIPFSESQAVYIVWINTNNKNFSTKIFNR